MRHSTWSALLSCLLTVGLVGGCGSSNTTGNPAKDGSTHLDAGSPPDGFGASCTNSGFTAVKVTATAAYPPIPGTGAITLGATSDDKDYATCTHCVLISKDCTANGCAKTFYATGGTLDIASIGDNGTQFTATLNYVTLVEVTIDATSLATTKVANGESWCLPSVTLDQLIGCNDNTQCTGNTNGATFCNTTTHACVECLGNSACATNQYGHLCDTAQGLCVECLGNNDCVGNQAGAVCDTTQGMCAVCAEDGDCAGNAGGAKCVSSFFGNYCGCDTSNDCTGSANGPVCDSNSGMCGCDPIGATSGCTGSQKCYPDWFNTGISACGTAGTAAAGATCAASNDCAPGVACFPTSKTAGTCVKMCDSTITTSTCPTSEICVDVDGVVGRCSCNPLGAPGAASACDSGKACYPDLVNKSGLYACATPGATAVGSSCNASGSCVANAACVPDTAGDGTCYPICDPKATTSVCTGGQTCQVYGSGISTCWCDPLSQAGCSSGEACYYYDGCHSPGTSTTDCTNDSDCAAGYLCDSSGACEQLCDANGVDTCASGTSCQDVGSSLFGLCQ